MIISGPLLLLASASGALAHSHIRSEQELAFHQASKRSLSHCQSSIRKRGLSSAATDRRAKLAHEVRAANGWSHAPLRKRDFEAALNKNVSLLFTNFESQP